MVRKRVCVAAPVPSGARGFAGFLNRVPPRRAQERNLKTGEIEVVVSPSRRAQEPETGTAGRTAD